MRRSIGPFARSLLATALLSCSVHEHELTPYEKDAQGNTGGTAGGTSATGGSAGTTQGGAGGSGGLADGAAGTGAEDAPADRSTDDPSQDAAIEVSVVDAAPPIDAPADGPAIGDGSTCLADCPPTVCGTISNNCGATLSCGPCELSSTFTPVDGVTLTTPRYAATAVRIGQYVYVIGGFNNGQYLSSVERATIDANGDLSPFSDTGITLVLARSGHTALFVNQQLYVIGGLSISYTPTVERAAVDGNGKLGAFATVSGVTLTTARGAHGSIVIGHNDYIIGGNASAALDNLETATFSSNGELSTFTPVPSIALATKRLGFGIVTIGHWLYVVGGATDIVNDGGSTPGYLTSFERAPFDRAGLVGTFGAVAGVALAVPRYKLGAFAFGPNLYAIGGTNDVNGTLASVEQGTIDESGDVTGPFTVSTMIALSTPRAGAAFLLVPPWLYVIGGHGNPGDLSSVERARVQ